MCVSRFTNENLSPSFKDSYASDSLVLQSDLNYGKDEVGGGMISAVQGPGGLTYSTDHKYARRNFYVLNYNITVSSVTH